MKAFLLIFSWLVSVGWSHAQEPFEVLPRGKEKIYKAEFKVIGNNIHGFLAVQHKRNHSLHVQFTSPMGNNLLEMVWKRGKWKKIYAIKKLGGKRIFSMMAEDILLLFAHYQYDKSFVDLGNEWRWQKKKLIPTFENHQLTSVKVITKRHRPSRTVRYLHQDGEWSEMSVDHQGFPFSIVVQPLKK